MDSDFDGPFDDNHDAAVASGDLFEMDPLLLIAGVVIIAILVMIGLAVLWWGRKITEEKHKAERIASALHIYDSVKYHLDKALEVPGSAVLERGRRVADILESRLGYVLQLQAKPGKLIGGLDTALKGDKPKPAGPAKVKVARATQDHALEVWAALQKLAKFWNQKADVLAMIEAAQIELSQKPEKLKKAVKVAPVVAPDAKSLHDVTAIITGPAPETGAPTPTVTPSSETPPEPEPPAPVPPSGTRKRLPAHKRNMLA